MGVSAKTNFESQILLKWLRSGNPITPALKAHPTLSMLLGSSSDAMVVDNSLGNIPGKKFSRNKLDEEARFISIPIRKGASNLTQLTRANMASARTGATPDVADLVEVKTAFALIPYNLPLDFLLEGKAKYWNGAGSAEQWLGNQIMEDYTNTVGGYLFAAGAGYIPGDGAFGSLRAQITDGQTAVARTYGPDDSAYANFLNITRASAYRSQVANGSSGAYTPKMALNMALACKKYGAGTLVAPMTLARYADFVDLLMTNYGQYEISQSDRDLLNFNGTDGVMVHGVLHYPDPDVPTGTEQMFINLDSVYSGSNYKNAIVRQAQRTEFNASDSLDTIFRHQLVVAEPWKCGIIYALESK